MGIERKRGGYRQTGFTGPCKLVRESVPGVIWRVERGGGSGHHVVVHIAHAPHHVPAAAVVEHRRSDCI
jgi:hypothetical protein